MTRAEIEKIRSEIELQIAKIKHELNDESKRFYIAFASVDEVFRSNSFETLVYMWIGSLNRATGHTYVCLNEDYILITRLQRLHQQLLELDVLEQAV